MDRPLIVVLHAEEPVRRSLVAAAESAGAVAHEARNPAEALELVRTRTPAILVADAKLAEADGGAWITRARRLRPSLVVVSTGGGARVDAFEAISGGDAAAVLRRAMLHHRALDEAASLRRDLQDREGVAGRLVGRSDAMEQLRARIERLAEGIGPVLFLGEPGTGKEAAARLLHALSSRAAGPFVAIDAAEAPGALGSDPSPEGTLFLDEIGDLEPGAQDRLAAWLAESSGRSRIVASSARDLERAAREGRFREDLFTRLAGSIVQVAPLREREGDVPILARHFVEVLRRINDMPALQLEAGAIAALERYRWPGNVRELRHAVEHAALLAVDGAVREDDLPPAVRAASVSAFEARASADRRFREAKREVVETFERAYLRDLLARHAGNVTAAATHSGMLRSALQRLLRKYDLKSSDFRNDRRVPVRDDAV